MTENVRFPVFLSFPASSVPPPPSDTIFPCLLVIRCSFSSPSPNVSTSPSSYEYVSFIDCFHAPSFVVDFSCFPKKKKDFDMSVLLFVCVLRAYVDMGYHTQQHVLRRLLFLFVRQVVVRALSPLLVIAAE